VEPLKVQAKAGSKGGKQEVIRFAALFDSLITNAVEMTLKCNISRHSRLHVALAGHRLLPCRSASALL
jgi:hypothetical protein